MAAITIGGTDIPVEEFEWEEPIEVGDSATAIDGSDLSTTDDYKQQGRGRTAWRASAAHATLLGVLETSGAQTFAGDLAISGVTSVRCTVGQTRTRYNGATAELSTAFRVVES